MLRIDGALLGGRRIGDTRVHILQRIEQRIHEHRRIEHIMEELLKRDIALQLADPGRLLAGGTVGLTVTGGVVFLQVMAAGQTMTTPVMRYRLGHLLGSDGASVTVTMAASGERHIEVAGAIAVPAVVARLELRLLRDGAPGNGHCFLGARPHASWRRYWGHLALPLAWVLAIETRGLVRVMVGVRLMVAAVAGIIVVTEKLWRLALLL